MKDLQLSYQAANEVFARTTEVIRDMVSEYASLDKATTEFKKVSDLTGASLDKYVNKLTKMGQATARTGSEMVEAATQFRKNSFNDADSAQLASVATMYQNVADTSISAADSASFIISQMRAFNITADDSYRIIDAVNEVAANFAVGTNDLSSALEVAGAGMRTYNNTYEQTIALVTAGSEIMTGRSLQVARGLNTIASRLVNNEELLAQYGIALNNSDGSMRSTFEILQDLSVAWQRMGDQERVSVGNTIAGVNQYKVLAAVMTNFDTAVKANEVALNSQGSAMRQNSVYMDSFQAKITQLKAGFQELANNVITSQLVNGALALFKGALDFLNTGIGSIITQTVLFGGAIWGLISKLTVANGIIPVIVGQFTQFSTLLKGGVAAGMAAAGGEATAFTAIMGGMLPVVLAVVAVIATLGVAFKALSDYQYSKSFQGIQDSIAETDDEIAKVQQDIDKYEAKLGSLTEAEQNYLQTLRDQVNELKNRKKEQEASASEAAARELSNALYGERDIYENGYYVGYETYNKAEQAFNSLVQQVRDGKRETADYMSDLQSYVQTWEPYIKALEKCGITYDNMTDEQRRVYNSLVAVHGEIDDLTKGLPKSESQISKFGNSFMDIKTGATVATQALTKFNEAISFDYSSALRGYQQAIDAIKDSISSGTMTPDKIKATAGLILTPEEIEAAAGSLDSLFETIQGKISGNLGRILGAADPLAELAQIIREKGGEITNEAGEVVASLDGDKLNVKSWEELGQALGNLPLGLMLALASAIQGISSSTVHTTDELGELAKELYNLYGIVPVASANFDTLAGAISSITGSADPVVIRDYIEALLELNGIEITPEVKAKIDEAIQNLDEVEEKAEKQNDTPVTIQFLAEGQDEVMSVYSSLANMPNIVKTVTIQTIETGGSSSMGDTSSPSATAQGSGGAGKRAKGVKSSAGETALVNDGMPINGSNAELIVQNGRAFIANEGETGIVDLARGARVYTAAETQAILRQKGMDESDFYGNGLPSFGNGGVSGRLPSSSGSGSGDSYFDGYEDTSSSSLSSGYVTSLVPPAPFDTSPEGIASMYEWGRQWSDEGVKNYYEQTMRERKHYLHLGLITEEQYYNDLYFIAEAALKDREGLQEEYWSAMEELYDYEHKAIKDTIDLEEKLNNLAKAKTQKVLVYKDGMFQYIQNTEAIAKAQKDLKGYANGTTSAYGGLSLVGENGPELRVLGNGDGIIPAQMTKNLMRMAGANISGASNGGDNYTFSIGTLKLEKVNNVDDLITGLKNVALQKVASRV